MGRWRIDPSESSNLDYFADMLLSILPLHMVFITNLHDVSISHDWWSDQLGKLTLIKICVKVIKVIFYRDPADSELTYDIWNRNWSLSYGCCVFMKQGPAEGFDINGQQLHGHEHKCIND